MTCPPAAAGTSVPYAARRSTPEWNRGPCCPNGSFRQPNAEVVAPSSGIVSAEALALPVALSATGDGSGVTSDGSGAGVLVAAGASPDVSLDAPCVSFDN